MIHVHTRQALYTCYNMEMAAGVNKSRDGEINGHKLVQHACIIALLFNQIPFIHGLLHTHILKPHADLGTCSVVTALPLCRLGSHHTHQPANALAPHYHYQLPLSVGWHLPSDEERMQWTSSTLNISIQDMYKLYIGDATVW